MTSHNDPIVSRESTGCARQLRIPRRQSSHQSQVHGRDCGRAPFGGFNRRDGLEGRWPGLFAVVHPDEVNWGEDYVGCVARTLLPAALTSICINVTT